MAMQNKLKGQYAEGIVSPGATRASLKQTSRPDYASVQMLITIGFDRVEAHRIVYGGEYDPSQETVR